MNFHIVSQLDSASDFIVAFHNIKKKIASLQEGLELGLIQQYLDEASIYIKQIPRDNNNVFRALSDALYFTQSQYKKIIDSYLRDLQFHSGVRELSTLLTMITTKNVLGYAKDIEKECGKYPEVDLVLMAVFFKLDLDIMYISNEGINTLKLYFAPAEGNKLSPFKLLLASDGCLDAVYSKSFINLAGITQSIILDTVDAIIKKGNAKEIKKHHTIYQNIEFSAWKLSRIQSVSQYGGSTDLPSVYLIDEETSYDKQKMPSVGGKKFISDSKLREDTPHKKNSQTYQINQVEGQVSNKRMQTGATPFIPKSISNQSKMNPFMTSQRMINGTTLEEPRITQGYQGILPEAPMYRKINEPRVPFSNIQFTPNYNQAFMPVVMQMIPMPVIQPPANATPGPLCTGILKFFDDAKNYGFFVVDGDGSDLFVHYDDLLKAGLSKDGIRMAKVSGIKFAFQTMSYYGKHNLSKKAINIQVLGDILPLPTMYTQVNQLFTDSSY